MDTLALTVLHQPLTTVNNENKSLLHVPGICHV